MAVEIGLNLALDNAITALENVKSDSSQRMEDIDIAIGVVATIGTRLRDGISTPEQSCEDLYDTYFAFQKSSQDTDAAHILRVVGDDLGINLDMDMDETWEMYERALRRAEIGLAAGYKVLHQKGLLTSHTLKSTNLA